MIRFAPVIQPDEFEARVERRGAVWLASHPEAKRPEDYWSEFKPALADGFGDLCAYSAMYEPVGTVDHFVSWKEDKSQAYQWSNYRYSAQWINASKQNISSGQIIDPFEVGDGWFEILLPSLQLVASASVPEAERGRVRFVLERLHLEHDERVMRQRREWYRMYQAGEINLSGLARKAPLIAEAVRKQQRLVAAE